MSGGGEEATPSGVLRSRFLAWTLAVAGLHLLLALLLYEPTLFPGGDNAGYMILGESLRTGRGYLDLYLPGEPVHTKYPPAYPALLAVLGWAGGVQLFKLASAALTTAAVALTALLGRRLVGPVAALVGAGLLAVNPVLLEYSHWVLSEAPFTALVLLSLWLLHRAAGVSRAAGGGGAGAAGEAGGAKGGVAGGAGAAAGGRGLFALGVLAAAAAFLTRTAGVPLLAAAALGALTLRNGRRAVGAGAVGLAVMVGWALFQRLGPPGQAGYLQELVLRNPYDPEAGAVGVAGLVTRAAGNFWRYVSEVFPAAVTGLAPGGAGAADGAGGLLTAAGVLLTALAVWGWLARILEEIGYAEWFTLLYIGLIAAWPEVWTDRRFLLPAIPLLLLYAVDGAARAARAARRVVGPGGGESSRGTAAGAGGRRRSATPGAAGAGRPSASRLTGGGGGPAGAVGAGSLAVLLGFPALANAVSLVPERVECVARWRAGAPCEAPAMASFYEAARWTAENTPSDAVVVNRKPRLFWWVSRRQGDVYRYSSEPSLVIAGLEALGTDYVVVDRISGTTLQYLVPAIQEYRGRFEVVYRGGEPPTPVLRFLADPGTALRPGRRPPVAIASRRPPVREGRPR